jgi:hypothetical protein
MSIETTIEAADANATPETCPIIFDQPTFAVSYAGEA